MKKRDLFALSLMGLAMVACSSDDEMNQIVNPQEGAFVSLQLDVAKPATKGSPDATNKQPGKDTENTISDVTVVVDYGTTQQTFTSSTSGATWDAGKKTLTFKAPEGAATFYVYANVNTADDLTSNWTTKLVSKATSVSDYYTDNKFFMSNQNGVGVTHTISSATANNVSVNIERAAAKVTVESKGSFTDDTHGGTIKVMSYVLGNRVSKFYLLQQNPIAIPTTDVQYLPTGNADPADWKNITLDQSVKGQSAVDKTTLDALYCMENVQNSYTEGNTTYAKFKTTFIPGKVLDFDTKTEGSGLTVKGTLKEVTDKTNPQTFYVVLDGRQDLTSNYILASDIKDKQGVTLEKADGAFTVKGIEGITKVSLPYTDGVCYFGPVWFNNQEDKSKSPVYRNDWYHLTVTAIKLPGSPVEPEGQGENPIDQGTDITVTASVLDWEWEERDIELQ